MNQARAFVPLVHAGLGAGLLVPAPAQAVAWTPVVDLQAATTDEPLQADVEVDDAGNVTAVWSAYRSTSDQGGDALLLASTHPVGGSWSAPTVIFAPIADADVVDFDLAVGAGGDAVVAWDTGYLESCCSTPGRWVR